MEKKYYTCKEVAERYGVCEDTVWSWNRSGLLSAVKIGRNYRVTSEQLEAFESKK